MRDDSSERDVHHITASFEALVEHFGKRLMLYAGDAEVVAHLERAKALAQHGLQLSRKLPD